MTLKRNIRIKDIAKKAGVSIGTVDRVLHKRGEVSEDTKKRIIQIIEELDYRPNILASTLASKKSIVFATLTPKASTMESYWAKPQQGIEKAIAQLRQYGIKITQFFFDMENPGSLTNEATRLLESSPDGILIAPWVQDEALLFAQKLDEKNIPYLFIDSTLNDAHPISFVAQNSLQSGYLAAKLIDYGIPGDGLILLFHLAKKTDSANHLSQREDGFLKYYNLKAQNDHRIVKIESSGSSEEIKERLVDLGIELCDVDGIFVTNSKVHVAAECFKDLCKTPKIVGYDLITKNIELLKSGKIDFLICQRPEAQGYAAIHLLFDYVIRKEQVKPENYISIDIITAENIDYYSSF
jgi:LacI family transcriptional regulator